MVEERPGITFERTNDWALIRKIATHPKIWPSITDDLSPKKEDWKPVENPEIWYVLARAKGMPFALFIFLPENPICWRSHVCMLPEGWGDIARMAFSLSWHWLWERTRCERIIGSVPVSNPLAIQFAVQCGMVKYGVNPKSVRKNGQLEDQVLLGINKWEAA